MLPSVTEILAALGLTRSYDGIDPKYAQRGHALHETVAWYLAGELDEASVHEDVRPGLDAFVDFQVKEGYVSLYSELELVHPFGFVGHVDLIGKLEGITVLDIKYSESPDLKAAALQLAGYRLLYDHAHPEEPAQACEVLRLSPKTGKYKRIKVTDDDATSIFLAAVVVYQAREGRKPR